MLIGLTVAMMRLATPELIGALRTRGKRGMTED